MKSAQWRESGLAPKAGRAGRESRRISEASADAAPGTVVLAAGNALQDLSRAAAIDGVGIDAAVLVAPLIGTPRYDRPTMVQRRIGPSDRGAGPAIFEGSKLGVSGNSALVRAHLPTD